MNATSSDLASQAAVSALYQDLLAAWNKHSASEYAELFDENGSVVGFDGSIMDGRSEIEGELSRIFADHETGRYVGKIRSVRLLSADTVLLHAVAGVIPAGQKELNPALNTIQSLVAVQGKAGWRIAHYHNTPAQFHGRPELSDALTEELRWLQ
ncbi:MAG: SgcJ/EcaC family oxidoreductase [Chloroflexi bacterium]|nr:MAG: SgcJ/EcaC family oxidoreductase [Chloroflexota bacterium]